MRHYRFRLRDGDRSPLEIAAVSLAALGSSTLAIALLRATIHVTYPAPVYLLAVLAVGMRYGTRPAIVVSVAAFLAYDFLFVEPLYTFTIASPDEWLNLLLLLAVALVIGRMVAVQTEQRHQAEQRLREAEALHAVTTVLAETRTVAEAAPVVLGRLADTTAMDRVWFSVGGSRAEEHVLADTGVGQPWPLAGWQVVLQRSGEGAMRWVRTHVPSVAGKKALKVGVYRVRVDVAGETVGSLWAVRGNERRDPDRAETRILSTAADQLGQALVRDRLAEEATSAEIARTSEALKTALLDSVSHDLRTPLATIRAAAGSMLDRSVRWSEDDHAGAFQAIDREAERMGRLVRNLLDLSRIEGGALKPELEALEVLEIVRLAVERLVPRGKRVEIRVPTALPPVLVDEVFVAQILANLLENAVRYGGSTIAVVGRDFAAEDAVEISVEDDGEGVPERAVAHLFEKFYQVPRDGSAGRRGMGIGLTVVAGLAHSMGGTVRAERSSLGGLSVVVTLRAATLPGAGGGDAAEHDAPGITDAATVEAGR